MSIQDELQFQEKVKRYTELYDIVDKHNKELEQIKAELKPYMKDKDIKTAPYGGRNLELVAQDRSKVDSDLLVNVLKKRLEELELDVYKVDKVYGEVNVVGRFYKDGEVVVRAEVNGETFTSLDDAREYLEEALNLNEDELQDIFSGSIMMPEYEKDELKFLISSCIETKEVPNEVNVKESVSQGALTMNDIAEATQINITYALMLKDPNKKKASKKK